jgi:hypothetical protein
MSYVPPWRRRQLAEPEVQVRKPRFIGNALGVTDVTENTGLRFTPRSPGATPTRHIRKIGPFLEPNTSPILRPTHNLTKVQPKFRGKVLASMRLARKTLKKELKRKGKSKTQIRKWLGKN